MPRHWRHYCHPVRLTPDEALDLFAAGEYCLLAFSDVPLPRLAIVQTSEAFGSKPQYVVPAPEIAVEVIEKKGLVVARCSLRPNLYHLVASQEYADRRRSEREKRQAMERERYGLI